MVVIQVLFDFVLLSLLEKFSDFKRQRGVDRLVV
jgi:hypothetical protein